MKVTLLASAHTLSSISDAIEKFYCGSRKVLHSCGPYEWEVRNPDGTALRNARVICKKGRFRFERIHSS
jgi:hypothetical protein